MCGIFGAAFLPDGEAGECLDRALASLRHRGPDGSGVVRMGGAVFGHTRLKVIDLSEAAAQPMRSGSGLLMVTFNGEIYNHQRAAPRAFEPRPPLPLAAATPRCCWPAMRSGAIACRSAWTGCSPSRSGTCAAAAAAVPRPRRREAAVLLPCARSGVLRFASEMKALLAAGRPRCAPAATALPDAARASATCPRPDDPVRGHRAAPARHGCLICAGQGADPASARYWEAPFATSRAPP